MDIFICKYENHENEPIIGFCVNLTCQNPSQYCYKCLMKVHSDHHHDCIRFKNLSDLINQYISFQGQIIQQSNKIFNQIKNQIQANFKRMEDNINTLKSLNQLLITQEYLKFKQSMHIIKQYYSLEQQKQEELFINQLNEFQKIIKQNGKENQQEMEKNFEVAKQLANEGKHEDALNCMTNHYVFKIRKMRYLGGRVSHYSSYKEQKKEYNVVIWPSNLILKMIWLIIIKDGHQTNQNNIKKLLSNQIRQLN
ncbi:unnamed protein product [Paramecium sonneborni]|uniref:B box-type domain-containing protein n=1 Tax=Paramecium sonneborni TaxID=65129 RepID=A0A8S1RTE6_9CILI|nr:unnamed protein product [Paramecium sonneborni]